jgi:hypothetical protein
VEMKAFYLLLTVDRFCSLVFHSVLYVSMVASFAKSWSRSCEG